MNTKARCCPLWALCLVLVSAQTSGQETLAPGRGEPSEEPWDSLRHTREFAEAEPLFRQALAIDLAALGPDHPEVAVTLRTLAGFNASQGNHPEAERFVRKSLEIQERVLGQEHWEAAASLEVFAALLRTTHREKEAKVLEVRAREIRANQTQTNPVK